MFNLYNLEYKKVEDFPEREQRNIVNNENRLNFLKIKYFLNFIFFAVLIGSVLFPVYQANAYLLNASDLVGQLDENNEPIFTKGVANNAPSNTGFNFNGSAAVAIDETGHHLFVSDQGNNRVLIFNLDSNNQLVDRIADYVLGQSTFSTNSAGTTQSGLNFPGGIAYDSVSKRLFVAEYTNNRVSVFDLSGGITNGMDASYVLGQPDFLTKTATTTQSGLSTPFYLAIDSDNQRLFVSDGNNNRVLVFNVAAGTMINNKAADYVLGQLNFTNAAGATQRGRLNTPRGLAYDSANQRLFIAEGYSSNRVMVFNVATGSMSNGKDADYVLGQTNFTSSTAATTQTGLSRATGLAYDLSTQRLFVAEELNNRITVFNVAPDSMSNGKAADNVLGQTDFTSSASSVAQNKLNLPQGLAYDSDNNRLFALDRNNNRIMIFNVSADSIANGENATDLLGQLDENDQPIYTKSAINNGPNNKGMNFSAYGILDSVNHRFFQEDYYNHRVLVFNLDSDNQFIDHAADYVLGQPDFYHNAAATTQNGFNNPTSFAYDSANQRLFVCDTGNYRVMVFDVSTITNGMNASYVLGQSDFVTKNAVVTQNGFSSYVEGLSLDLDNQRLFVADRNNNRVLVFDLSGGIANGMNASYVLGQPDFVTSSFATNQVGMYYPVVVLYDSVQQRLFVSENKNHRVTVFDVSTIVNGESAINVLGQPDFTHNTAATTQNGLWAPIGLGYDSKDKMLFVNDAGNNRVMIFDLLSLTDGQNAVTNLAQSDFVSKTTGTTADKFKFPDGLDYDPISSRLFSGDSTNHRLLIFEIPKITSTSLSSAIIGQNYSSSISATGGQAPYTCQLTSGSLPTGLSISTDCVISGVPQGSLDYDFTVRVYDSSITSPGTLGLWDDKTYNISEYQGSNEDGDNERDLNVNKVKATSTENSITITWKTDHNAKSIIRYGTDKNLKEKKKDNSKEKKHKIILDNLASDTQYYFRIKAEDGDDNEDRSKVHSIRTLAASNSNPNLNNVAVAKTVTPIYSGNAEPNVCSYTVQTGDSLWTIAQTVYGNGAAYPLIIEKNKEKYSNIASRLSVGQELTFNCGEATVEGVTDTKDDNGVDSPEINQPSSSDSKFRWWNPLSWF